MPSDPEAEPLLPNASSAPSAPVPVYGLVHLIRADLLRLIDTPLSTEQLTSPAITFAITRPLQHAYLALAHPAILFALLVNRVQFINDSTHTLTLHSVNATRATLCESLATAILRKLHEPPSKCPRALPHSRVSPQDQALLRSANLLATAFSLFDGAPPHVLQSLQFDWGNSDAGKILSRQSNALEMAIVSEAKQFIRSPACQRVIDAIWTGKIVYTSTSIVDILSDRYKHRPVSLYNPRNAPLLNHYRLAVPRNRNALEYFHYFILIVSYVLTLHTRQLGHMNALEIWFNIFTMGFAADKLGSILEHGWLVFIANLWNGLDLAFIFGHLLYFVLRIMGLIYLSHYRLESHWLNQQSHQVLSCLATLIFPRLAFVTLSDNLLILSLRSMLSDFLFLMVLGAWCFMGFLYSLYCLQLGRLAQNSSEVDQHEFYSFAQIAQWMVFIFFGLDSTGISKAHEFHEVLGPAIFIVYACLSNTLLVTVMVSILSKIFSDISNDAIAETLYRKAVLTFEGVKSDAIFSFQPPFNLAALVILITLKPILTPRKFHTVVVFLCRFFGCPVLLTISFFERYLIGGGSLFGNADSFSIRLTMVNSLGGLTGGVAGSILKNNIHRRKPNKMSQMSTRISRNLRKFGGVDVINACFDYEAEGPMVSPFQVHDNQNDSLRRANDGKKAPLATDHEQAPHLELQDEGHHHQSTLRPAAPGRLRTSKTVEQVFMGSGAGQPHPHPVSLGNSQPQSRSQTQPGAPSALERLFLGPEAHHSGCPLAVSSDRPLSNPRSPLEKTGAPQPVASHPPDRPSAQVLNSSPLSSPSTTCPSQDSSTDSSTPRKKPTPGSTTTRSGVDLPPLPLSRAGSVMNLRNSVNKPASIVQDEEEEEMMMGGGGGGEISRRRYPYRGGRSRRRSMSQRSIGSAASSIGGGEGEASSNVLEHEQEQVYQRDHDPQQQELLMSALEKLFEKYWGKMGSVSVGDQNEQSNRNRKEAGLGSERNLDWMEGQIESRLEKVEGVLQDLVKVVGELKRARRAE